MILSKLILNNFKKYKSYEIEFNEGLVGIIGRNGSGKSTIFEAILFALYGEFKNKGYKEVVRNSEVSVKDAVMVELTFELDSVSYRVLREFRGKTLSASAKFFKNEELVSSGVKEVTQSIIRLTKMSKDAFMHTLFASQKELASLSSLKNEDRKKMIRRLLGLEKIDFVEKELTEKSRELKRDIGSFAEVLLSDDDVKEKHSQIEQNSAHKKALEELMATQLRQLNTTRLKELEIKKELDSLQLIKENKQRLQSLIELKKSSISSNTQNQKKLHVELHELKLKQQELNSLQNVKPQYEKLTNELKEQEALKTFHLKKEGLLKEQEHLREQYKKIKNELAQLEKECENYDETVFSSKDMELSLAMLQDKIMAKHTIENELLAEIAGEQKQIDITNEKIEKLQLLGRESVCPTCTRPLLEEYDNVIDSLNSVVQDIHKKKIDEYKTQLQKVQTQKKAYEEQKQRQDKEFLELSKAVNLMESKKKDIVKASEYFKVIEQNGHKNNEALKELEKYNYDEKAHNELRSTLDELKIKYEHVLSLETTLKRVDVIKKESADIAAALETLHVELKKAQDDEKNLHYDEKAHRQKIQESVETGELKESQSNVLNETKVNIAKIEGEIKTLQAALDNNYAQLKKVQTKKEDLQDYEKIKISLAEFKTKLNSKVAPRISNIASQMYSQITKGKYQHIEVSTDFDFFIYDDGKKYPIERFSGGEVDLANLVLRIAISKTLTELSGATNIEFLAFDEVFGSQDESRRIEILEAFQTIKEQYRQIFLISHESEIKEMFEWVVEL